MVAESAAGVAVDGRAGPEGGIATPPGHFEGVRERLVEGGWFIDEDDVVSAEGWEAYVMVRGRPNEGMLH